MKALERHPVLAASLFTLVLGSPLTTLAAQRAQTPAPDSPRIMVGTFRSDDRALGAQAADALRQRITGEMNPKQLWVISKTDLENTLKASGYPPDSALAPTDLRELAKLVRADYIVDGTVGKSSGGVKVDARLMLARDVSLAQPLALVEARDVGAAAKQLERQLEDALKQLPDNKKCENALRAQKFDEAVTAARAGIKAFPQATLARLCLMTAYSDLKYPPDSIIRVANEILQVDPRSKMALVFAADAYKTKGDTARAIQKDIELYRADPTNTPLVTQIINELASSGNPTEAIKMINELMKDNPGDPQLLRTRWLLLLKAKQWKDALAAGDELVKSDTAAATTDFFLRQISVAATDSQPQVAAQIAARAVQRFPANVELLYIYARQLRASGQLQQSVAAARRILQVDPKNQEAWLLVAATQNELKQPADTILATIKAAVAAGIDKKLFSPIVLGQANEAFKVANTTKSMDDWGRTLMLAAVSDSLNPTPTAAFFQGVASFSIGIDALQAAQKQKSCADAHKAQDMLALTSMTMPRGGSIDAGTAKQILDYVQQYSAAPAQMIKVYCK